MSTIIPIDNFRADQNSLKIIHFCLSNQFIENGLINNSFIAEILSDKSFNQRSSMN